MGSIYLIRHGQASFGALDYDVLSPLGKRQAEILGTHLVRSGIGFDRCISGSGWRIRQKKLPVPQSTPTPKIARAAYTSTPR